MKQRIRTRSGLVLTIMLVLAWVAFIGLILHSIQPTGSDLQCSELSAGDLLEYIAGA